MGSHTGGSEPAGPESREALMPQPAPGRKLTHGAQMPSLGLGTSPLRGQACVDQVRSAIEAGYRLIDTAENYGNEDAVGQAIRESGVDRSEIFLTTKLNRQWHSVSGVRAAYEASLERLGLDSIDLLLIHWPNPDQGRYVEAVQGLEELRQEGLLRAIGTSNFTPAHLRRVYEETGLSPDVNQIQLSPYATRDQSRAYHDEYGIATESWSPLGASGTELRNDPVVLTLAERYDMTPAQVVLRWHYQLGLVAIPRSSHPGRIRENLSIFSFELSADDVAQLSALDRGEAEVVDSDTFGH
ncbi:MAG: 2,5-diketo-D-gluconate reductase [Friedmanniella sp.]|nr:2,5-diketo-D-gluconate reductase [Friedmanniella sp.]